MAELTVNNETFNYPDPGTEPGWGNDATEWAKAVTEVLTSLAGPGTINEVQSNILNNTTTPTPVAGLVFNSDLTQSAIIMYRIYRDSDDISPLVEQGRLDIFLDNGVWTLSREVSSPNLAHVEFDIDVTGQISYKSSDIPGDNYIGFIKFKTTGILT